MIGMLWNIRGLGKIDRLPALRGKIKDQHVHFIGVMETKKSSLSDALLKSLGQTQC
jgi:hypothetical protein